MARSFSSIVSRWKSAEGNNDDGFSLIELLVVMSIILLITTVAVPQFLQYLDRAKSDSARVAVDNIGASLDLYKLDIGRYPTQTEGLQALLKTPDSVPRWNGPYLKRAEMIVDPWSNEYHYKSPGTHGAYDLFSYGADNAEGGDGVNKDVTSW